MALVKKEFETPLYGNKFTVVIYDSNDDFKKEFVDVDFNPKIEDFDGGVFKRNKMLYIVFSSEKDGYPSPGIIAHEAKHLVNNIFVDICCELDRYNDEPECYLLGWIVNRVCEVKNTLLK